MSTSVVVKVTKPLWFRTERYTEGQTIRTTALDAAALVDSGRAVLAHEPDAQALHEARIAEVKAALAAAGRPWHQPRPAPPWQRRA